MNPNLSQSAKAPWLLLLTISLLAIGCARAPGSLPTPSLTGAESPQSISDDASVQASDQRGQTANHGGLSAGDHTIRLRHGGRWRSYIVHVPPAWTEPAPVVIALHGGGGTGRGFQEENGLDVIADREGFIAVYPEGTGVLPNRLHTWNSGETCCGFALDNDIDDVGFLRRVIDDLSSHLEIDQGRVYMTGHSNGAMMAYRFAAEASDLVTAIAPVAGSLDLPVPPDYHPVAMLHIHSVDDPRALYVGGEGPPFPGTDRTVNHEPVLAGVKSWVNSNGCFAEPTATSTGSGEGNDAGQSWTRIAWTACDPQAHVEHLVLEGSGHGWPGVEVGWIWQRLLGPPTTMIIASEEVWSFVSRFAR